VGAAMDQHPRLSVGRGVGSGVGAAMDQHPRLSVGRGRGAAEWVLQWTNIQIVWECFVR